MEQWQELLAGSISRPAALAGRWSLDSAQMEQVTGAFPARVNPYFASLVREEGDPIWRQVLPSTAELADRSGQAGGEGGCPLDPLHEERHSPLGNLVHRYPDRVLFLVCSACAVLCRFCTRRRLTGPGFPAGEEQEDAALRYIRSRPEVREVILSGGDPLLLADDRLRGLLARLRQIPHVRALRLHTRAPGVLPQRVTPALAALLAERVPVRVNLHFNHPRELTPRAREAVTLLARAGVPLGSQTVLLAGVNDDPGVLAELFRLLSRLGVRPYYLFQADTVRGTSHFRVPIGRALALGQSLRLAAERGGVPLPTLAIDLPQGGGKVPLTPDRVARRDGLCFVRGLEGAWIEYPDAG